MENRILIEALENLNKILEPEDNGKWYDINTSGENWVVNILGKRFLCVVKNIVTTSNFGSLCKELTSLKNYPVILVARYIYPRLMRELMHRGINSMDVVGNCEIKAGTFIIHVEGKRRSNKLFMAVGGKSRLFQETGLKIIFQLLTDPYKVNFTYRDIQELVGVSLGSVYIIMNELEEKGFILKTDERKVLKNKIELLERWSVAFNDVLKPKLFVKRMTFRDSTSKSNWFNLPFPPGVLWGGEPAANMRDGYLYPDCFTIYGGSTGVLVKAGLRVDEDGEIFVYNKFWKKIDLDTTVPAILIYADLMGSGNSRNIEAAQRILEHELQYLQS